MTPAHVTPFVPKRIVLVKQVVFAVEIHEAVGVVDPVGGRGEVKIGAVGLFVGLGIGFGKKQEAGQQADCDSFG